MSRGWCVKIINFWYICIKKYPKANEKYWKSRKMLKNYEKCWKSWEITSGSVEKLNLPIKSKNKANVQKFTLQKNSLRNFDRQCSHKMLNRSKSCEKVQKTGKWIKKKLNTMLISNIVKKCSRTRNEFLKIFRLTIKYCFFFSSLVEMYLITMGMMRRNLFRAVG